MKIAARTKLHSGGLIDNPLAHMPLQKNLIIKHDFEVDFDTFSMYLFSQQWLLSC